MIIDLKSDLKDIIKDLEIKFQNIFKTKIQEDFMNNPYTKYLVYLKDNEVLGFLNYYLIYDRIEIVNFNVLEDYQNEHIGSSLLEKLIEIGCEKKLKNITLEVRIDNKKAIIFMKSMVLKKLVLEKIIIKG